MKKTNIKILDRYIIGKFLGTFLFTILIAIVIVVIFDLSEKIDKFVNNHAPLRAIILDYYLPFIPYYMNMFSPLFVFITVIFFTSRMAANSEIIAMLASGTSFKRLMRPYMVSCVLISLVTFYLGAYVIPHGTVIRQNVFHFGAASIWAA